MSPRVAAVVPAKDEGDRVAATVTALLALDEVALVIVVDDGSSDETVGHAAAAGAIVVRHPVNRGKAAALETGVARLAEEETRTGAEPHVLLFADADLAESAAHLAPSCHPSSRGVRTSPSPTSPGAPRPWARGGSCAWPAPRSRR